MTLPIIYIRSASGISVAPEAVGAVLVHVDAPLAALNVARPVEARPAARHGLVRPVVLLAAELEHVDVAAPLARFQERRERSLGGRRGYGDGCGLVGEEGEGQGEGLDGEHFCGGLLF